MGNALLDIYRKDLPVFITTDMILHVLHASYDNLLLSIEMSILIPNLEIILDNLQNLYSTLITNYGENNALQTSLADIDLYITITQSLFGGQLQTG